MTTVDKQTQAVLDQMAASGAPPLYEMSVPDARIAIREATFQMDAAKIEVHKREEKKIPGPNGDIPIRIYWPRAVDENERLPVLLLYHGGGHTIGDMDTHENVSRYFCIHGDLIVINVDYRLAPEHKFPAGIDDSYAALCWAAGNADDINGDPARIAVIGDSAGGNISAVMCQEAKRRNGPAIAYQVLLYPGMDFNLDHEYESLTKYGEGGYFLTIHDMRWLAGNYLTDIEKEKDDPRVSPIITEDLNGLPPALVITAGFDPICDHGKHYADRLIEAGVNVEYHCFETTIHGFISFSGVTDIGKEGLALTASCLKKALIEI